MSEQIVDKFNLLTKGNRPDEAVDPNPIHEFDIELDDAFKAIASNRGASLLQLASDEVDLVEFLSQPKILKIAKGTALKNIALPINEDLQLHIDALAEGKIDRNRFIKEAQNTLHSADDTELPHSNMAKLANLITGAKKHGLNVHAIGPENNKSKDFVNNIEKIRLAVFKNDVLIVSSTNLGSEPKDFDEKLDGDVVRIEVFNSEDSIQKLREKRGAYNDKNKTERGTDRAEFMIIRKSGLFNNPTDKLLTTINSSPEIILEIGKTAKSSNLFYDAETVAQWEKEGRPALRYGPEAQRYKLYAPPGSYDDDLPVGKTRLLILEPNNDKTRHDEYVSHIARRSAEALVKDIGGKRPEIHIRSGSVDAPTLAIKEFIHQADVINYSAGWNSEDRRFNFAVSLGISDPTEKFNYMNNEPIVVQATGNHGDNKSDVNHGDYDEKPAENIQFYPYSIMVGEVTENINWIVELDQHSGKVGPTLVYTNPSDSGDRFLYFEDLTKLSEKRRKSLTIDQDGFVSGLQGTTFSGPGIAGVLAAAKENYPDLSNSELIATLCASCTHPDPSDRNIKTLKSGLQFSSFKMGYGVFDPKKFAKNLEEMHDIAKDNPLKDDKESLKDFEDKKDLEIDGKKYSAYSFEVTKDLSMTKIAMYFQLQLKTKPPSKVILRSPAGTEIPIPCHAAAGAASFSTEAFMGEDTKGTWTLIMPQETPLAKNDGKEKMKMILESYMRRNISEKEKEDIKNSLEEQRKKGDFDNGSRFHIYGQEKGPEGQSNLGTFYKKLKGETPEQEASFDETAKEITKPAESTAPDTPKTPDLAPETKPSKPPAGV